MGIDYCNVQTENFKDHEVKIVNERVREVVNDKMVVAQVVNRVLIKIMLLNFEVNVLIKEIEQDADLDCKVEIVIVNLEID